jgi:hypothetical protein
VGLPRTQSGYEFPLDNCGPQLAELYLSGIACFHGVPMRIMSDRETQAILMF